jgi:hypothetical protein
MIISRWVEAGSESLPPIGVGAAQGTVEDNEFRAGDHPGRLCPQWARGRVGKLLTDATVHARDTRPCQGSGISG